jgi:hypothetical protein
MPLVVVVGLIPTLEIVKLPIRFEFDDVPIVIVPVVEENNDTADPAVALVTLVVLTPVVKVWREVHVFADAFAPYTVERAEMAESTYLVLATFELLLSAVWSFTVMFTAELTAIKLSDPPFRITLEAVSPIVKVDTAV